MTSRPIKNVAASIRARLANRARDAGRPHQEVVQFYAMERFLYRLSESQYRDRFILKGALMLIVWNGSPRRPTSDIDLLGRIDNNPDHVARAVREICAQSVEPDGIEFDPTSVRVVPIAEEAEYDGVRVQFQGRLDTIRLHMQIDFGFGDQVFPKPMRSGYPTIFDMPAPSLLTYSRETAIAEKLHVIFVREQLNSRMKDYFDIWWLASQFEFDGEQLAEAIRRTCQQRETEVPGDPVGLSQDLADDPSKITQWRAFRRHSGISDIPEEFGDVLRRATEFLRPVLSAIAADRSFHGTWKPCGPWA